MAALAPLYEIGIPRFTSPVLMLFFLAIAVLFLRRSAWTWRPMKWIAITEIALNAIFFPNLKYYGTYTAIAQVLIALVMAACCVILLSMTHNPNTAAWFSRR